MTDLSFSDAARVLATAHGRETLELRAAECDLFGPGVPERPWRGCASGGWTGLTHLPEG